MSRIKTLRSFWGLTSCLPRWLTWPMIPCLRANGDPSRRLMTRFHHSSCLKTRLSWESGNKNFNKNTLVMSTTDCISIRKCSRSLQPREKSSRWPLIIGIWRVTRISGKQSKKSWRKASSTSQISRSKSHLTSTRLLLRPMTWEWWVTLGPRRKTKEVTKRS